MTKRPKPMTTAELTEALADLALCIADIAVMTRTAPEVAAAAARRGGLASVLLQDALESVRSERAIGDLPPAGTAD